jgi:HSP20 family molecular chaperone IbpA
MFKKNKCPKCKKGIEDKYSFCPYCGNKVYEGKDEGDDWGMLGKDDFMAMDDIRLPAGFNSIFNSLIKNLSKEMDAQLKKGMIDETEPKKVKRDGVSISISTFGNGPPKIKVTQLGEKQNAEFREEKGKKFKSNLFTKEKTKEFTSLPREEPKTNVRRFSDKVVFELEMPGVKSTEDVSIIKLENSIEIKAIGKKKAYAKMIPINLPIKDYSLSDGKLTIELGVKN